MPILVQYWSINYKQKKNNDTIVFKITLNLELD